MDDELRAFEGVDFQWVQSLDSIWRTSRYDVPSLHQRERQEVLAKLRTMAASPETGSPLGWVYVAPVGYGKTHLLSAIRREAMEAGNSFVLVDMTDVRDFWETVLLGFIDSFQKPADAKGRTQAQLVVQHIVGQVQGDDGAALASELETLRPPRLVRVMDDLVQRLGRTHRAQTLKHADALRALILLNSDDMVLSNLGNAWLQGYGVDEDAMELWGFNIREKRPSAVVEGLSWLASLRSPIVVALDAIDVIMSEFHLADAGKDLPEEHAGRHLLARSVIEGVGRGLLELRDVVRRALVVVPCLNDTWENISQFSLQSVKDRFESTRRLKSIGDAEMAALVVRARLATGYALGGFTPPYPTWPFAPAAFASIALAGLSPRQLLKRCEQHRRACAEEGRVREISAFPEIDESRTGGPVIRPDQFMTIDKEFERARASSALPDFTREPDGEDELGKLLLAGCRIVVEEQPPNGNVELVVDAESGGGRGYSALHARVRQILTSEKDREKHLCVRAIWKDHHIAFQARLTAAVTASGIDRRLVFRKLVLVRNAPPPGGAKTAQMMTKARSAGAEFVTASDADLRVLAALRDLRKVQGDRLEAFIQWLRSRRPASQLALMKPIADWLSPSAAAPEPQAGNPASKPQQAGNPAPKPQTGSPAAQAGSPAPWAQQAGSPAAQAKKTGGPAAQPPNAAAPFQDASHATPPTSPMPPAPRIGPFVIAVGHQVIGDRLATPQSVLAEDLKQHVVVLAGAGSGKTVLLRRLIEETALIGIPSIVVDGANDLARLGEPWPARPSTFTGEDDAKAARYHAETDVIVWTPGRSSGNPLHLGLLPDFAAVAHDPDELTQAVGMTVETLAGMAGKKVDNKGRGILDAALRVFAAQGGGDLSSFLDLLADLPAEANLGISTAAKVATGLSDSLRAAVQTNPLLHQEGKPLDPGVLFGLGSGRARVSVLSMVGLPGTEAPLQFVNQLAMTLFTWVKKNPCPSDQPLRGLLVLDEAKDFVPSQSSTPCKESLIRLAAQGRKYGLGVVFATQAPKSIDHNVIANASTQFYGKASSPAAIDTVEEQLRARGGSGADVARLPAGRFYLAGKGMPAPLKIAVPLCLSHHPASPPDEVDVLRRAASSRARLR